MFQAKGAIGLSQLWETFRRSSPAALSLAPQVAGVEIRQQSRWDDGVPMKHLGQEQRAI